MIHFAAALALTLPLDPSSAEAINASGGPLRPDQACFDVGSYALSLDVDPDAKRIDGQLILRATATRDTQSIALQLDNRLTVSKVDWLGVEESEPTFEHEDGVISIGLPVQLSVGQEFSLQVDYAGQPREAPRPPWDGGFTWQTTPGGKPWISTTCQGEGADLWWPCKDHPSDKAEQIDLRITVPAGLVCASNGVLIDSREVEKGRHLFHWRLDQPISNYNVALNIAPYRLLERRYTCCTGDEMPLVFYCLPDDVDRAETLLDEIERHLAFFEAKLGPYPFRSSKYGVVQTPHLGMEHQTIIAYGYKFRHDQWDYDWLHHHEASHEWWANLVTCSDWKDMWIHEGFGTYMQALWVEETHQQPGYFSWMKARRRGLKNRRPVAPREVRDSKQIYFDKSGGFDNDIYDKGAWVLHTLRWHLGDEAFFRGLRRCAYPTAELEAVKDGSQVRFSDTEEIRSIFERESKQDLAAFFEAYLRQPELPELLVEHDKRQKALRLRWKAPVETSTPFALAVPVRIGAETTRVAVSSDAWSSVPMPRRGRAEVDPDGWLLKR